MNGPELQANRGRTRPASKADRVPLVNRSNWRCQPIAAGGGFLRERPVYFGSRRSLAPSGKSTTATAVVGTWPELPGRRSRRNECIRKPRDGTGKKEARRQESHIRETRKTASGRKRHKSDGTQPPKAVIPTSTPRLRVSAICASRSDCLVLGMSGTAAPWGI